MCITLLYEILACSVFIRVYGYVTDFILYLLSSRFGREIVSFWLPLNDNGGAGSATVKFKTHQKLAGQLFFQICTCECLVLQRLNKLIYNNFLRSKF